MLFCHLCFAACRGVTWYSLVEALARYSFVVDNPKMRAARGRSLPKLHIRSASHALLAPALTSRQHIDIAASWQVVENLPAPAVDEGSRFHSEVGTATRRQSAHPICAARVTLATTTSPPCALLRRASASKAVNSQGS